MPPAAAQPHAALAAGIDSYTYHRLFGVLRAGEVPPSQPWSAEDLVTELAAHDPDAVAYQTMFLPAPGSPPWQQLPTLLASGPVVAALSWGGDTGLDGGRRLDLLPDLEAWVGAAADLGAPVLRIVLGGPRTPSEVPLADRLRLLVPHLRLAVSRAADRGVGLAVENHADLDVEGMSALLDAVGDDRLAVVLDVANMVRVGADPVAAARTLAPRVVMVHVRDLTPSRRTPRSDPLHWPCRAPGEGELPIAEVIEAVAALHGAHAPLVAVELTELDTGQGTESGAVARGLAWLRSLPWVRPAAHGGSRRRTGRAETA